MAAASDGRGAADPIHRGRARWTRHSRLACHSSVTVWPAPPAAPVAPSDSRHLSLAGTIWHTPSLFLSHFSGISPCGCSVLLFMPHDPIRSCGPSCAHDPTTCPTHSSRPRRNNVPSSESTHGRGLGAKTRLLEIIVLKDSDESIAVTANYSFFVCSIPVRHPFHFLSSPPIPLSHPVPPPSPHVSLPPSLHYK